jgi:hypothetical protein
MKRVFVFAFALLVFAACKSSTEPEKVAVVEEPAAPVVQGPTSILDATSTAPLESSINAFAAGNIDGFTSGMADDVKFYYPGPGDSLVGKQAVNAFYKQRWTLIDSVQVINPTYLGVKVNESKSVGTGDYLMAWYVFAIKYKNGKRLALPVHTVRHNNSAGNADMIAMYYDMHKVMVASAK